MLPPQSAASIAAVIGVVGKKGKFVVIGPEGLLRPNPLREGL
jgi:hypothetical protein